MYTPESVMTSRKFSCKLLVRQYVVAPQYNCRYILHYNCIFDNQLRIVMVVPSFCSSAARCTLAWHYRAFFQAWCILTIAVATTLIFMAPVFTTAISSSFLREHVGWLGRGAFQPASLLSLVSAFFHASLLIRARHQRHSKWLVRAIRMVCTQSRGSLAIHRNRGFRHGWPDVDDAGLSFRPPRCRSAPIDYTRASRSRRLGWLLEPDLTTHL